MRIDYMNREKKSNSKNLFSEFIRFKLWIARG